MIKHGKDRLPAKAVPATEVISLSCLRKKGTNMGRASPRQARRMMQRLGMNVEPIPSAKQVIIRTENREILIDNPETVL